ncbi:hypothetical protein ERO13_D10G046100v2 [Gossypium hirsutum]|nr:hypothetical protein ERO13_D10G046100v2 [Gossypium hirsutum]
MDTVVILAPRLHSRAHQWFISIPIISLGCRIKAPKQVSLLCLSIQ